LASKTFWHIKNPISDNIPPPDAAFPMLQARLALSVVRHLACGTGPSDQLMQSSSQAIAALATLDTSFARLHCGQNRLRPNPRCQLQTHSIRRRLHHCVVFFAYRDFNSLHVILMCFAR
jgi:hypothetical protein